MEELLLSALITGGGSSDGNFTDEVGAADGSAVVALANEAGGGVAASAVAALAIAAGGGVTAAGWSVVVALAVAAGGEAGVFGSSFAFRRASLRQICFQRGSIFTSSDFVFVFGGAFGGVFGGAGFGFLVVLGRFGRGALVSTMVA